MFKVITKNSIDILGKLISFPCSIMKDPDGKPFIVLKEDLVIVNFYPATLIEGRSLAGIDMERNIWAFDRQGCLVWKIQPAPINTGDKKPYTSVYKKKGKVFGGNWCGIDVEINLRDGSVSMPSPQRPW